jgi:hypothetical protein
MRPTVIIAAVPVAQALVAGAAFLACAGVGGAVYEGLVLDPVWPNRPAIVQPRNGGVSRRRFWIPVHAALEVALVVATIACWGARDVRTALLIALASHLVMRGWTLADLGPKAVAFERADPATIERATARRWVRRSRMRLALDAVTCVAALTALALT